MGPVAAAPRHAACSTPDGKKQMVGLQAVMGHVVVQLADPVVSELKATLFLVLGVVLDDEPRTVGPGAACEMHDGSGHRQHASREVQVLDTQLR